MKQAEFSDSVVEVKFGAWCLNIKRQIISDGTVEKELEPLLYKILSYLILNQNMIITRENLIEDVWCQTYVDDNAINRAISELRKILKSPQQSELVVKTHYRKGYSFVPSVEFIESEYQNLPIDNLNKPDVIKKAKPVINKTRLRALLLLLLVSILLISFIWPVKNREVKTTYKDYQEEVLSMKDGTHSFLVLSPNEKNLAFIVSKNEGLESYLINKDLITGREKVLFKIGYELTPVGWSYNNSDIIYRQNSGKKDCQVFIIDSNFIGEAKHLFDCNNLPFFGEGVNNTNFVYSKLGYRNRDELAVLMNRNLITGEEYQISSPNLNSYGDKFLAHIEDKNKVVFERHQFGFSELYIADTEGGAQTHLYTTKNRIWSLNYDQKSNSLLWYDNVDNILYQYSLVSQKLLQKVSMQGVSGYSTTLPLSPSEMLATQYPYTRHIYQLSLDALNLEDIAPENINTFNAQNTNNGYIYYLLNDAQIKRLAVLDTATGTVSIKSNIIDFSIMKVSSDGEELLALKSNVIDIRDTAELSLKDTITVDGNIVNVEYLNNKNIGYILRGDTATSNTAYLYDRATKKSMLLPISNPVWFEQLSTSKFIFLSAQNKLQIFDSWNNLITHEFELNSVLYKHSFALNDNKLFHSDGSNIYLYDLNLGFKANAELIYTLKVGLITQLSYAKELGTLAFTTITINNNKLVKAIEVPK